MGTEQQQELKSEKPLTKQQRKTIPFKDNSIENWKPKKPRERRGFPKSTTTNRLKTVSRWKLWYTSRATYYERLYRFSKIFKKE